MKRVVALSIVLAVGLSLAFIGSLQAQSQAPAPAAPKAAEPKKAESKPAGGKSKDAKIHSAMSAGPKGISKDATVLDYPEKEGAEPAVLRKGTNEWTCFPDDPSTPSNDPMCMDKNSMEWAQAWMGKKEPKLSGPGIGYMLQGGGSASNTDPFAKKPPAGEKWMKEAPHVMVFPNGKLDPKVYGTDPHTGRPWIMWAGTPYEHLMVPVK